MKRIALALVLGCLLVSSSFAAEGAALRRQQQAQEKARAITRQLVSRILDIQLRQLRENGLENQPVYRDIESMRGNLDELVRADMDEVVQLLVEAQQGPEQTRLTKFQQAQDRVRDIMLTLMAERQKLLKRLQIAEISAHVRRMIEFEQQAYDQTKTLPSLAQTEREPQALTVIKEQDFVKQMFLQLVTMLRDMTDWGGKVGAGASEGLRILKTAQVGEELDNADERLRSAEFPAAAESQFAVLQGLRALLEKLEETQGLVSSDREEALRMIREMLEKQEELRTQTQQEQRDENQLRELVDQQAQLHKDLNQLSPVLDDFPTTTPLLEQAKASAFQASAELFENRQEEAVAEQTKVIGALAEIEQQLQNAVARESADRSADELASDVQKLAETKQKLEEIAETQEQATKNAKEKPAEAQKQEAAVAEQLAKVAAAEELPSVVKAPIQDAQEAAAEAQKALDDSAPEAADTREAAVMHAEDALERALAQVEAELADTRRRQKAVEVGELARAAEALERAAAAERRIAEQAQSAAEAEGLDEAEAAAMLAEHEAAQETARRIQEGVKNTAPDASQKLAQAADPLKKAGEQLMAAKQKPGEPSKPQAAEASKQAAQAADALERSAQSLRQEAKQAAEELAQVSGEQLQQIGKTQQAVENALSRSNDAAIADPLKNIEAAMEKVQEAQIAQTRASGRPEAAAAMQLARDIGQARAQQQEANRAAENVAKGKAASPLDAALVQQAAAEQIAAAAKDAQGEIAEALKKAAEAASQAAKDTLGGKPSQAEAARQAAQDGLAQAQEMAEAAIAKAMEQPAGQPNATAQDEVGEAIAEAQAKAAQSAPQAGQPLAQAAEKSDAAAKALEQGDAQAASEPQKQAGEALAQAAQELQEAAAAMAADTGQQLAEQGMDAGKLAQQAAKADPAAAAALQQAQQAALPAGAKQPVTARQAAQAQAEMTRNMERAAASLAARQQQIRRDQQIAEALAGLLETQQAAREAIAQNAAALGEMAQAALLQPGEKAPLTAAQMSAADALARATQQFAQTQQATGEGAVAVSGQQEVANPEVRAGLEAASQLAGMPLPAIPPMGEPLAASGAPAGQATPTGKGQPAPPSPSAGTEQPAAQAPALTPGQPAADQAPPTPGGQPQAPGDLAGQGAPGAANPAAMGTGFVPQSPGITAEQIAGAEALSQAAQALAQALGQPGQPEGPMPGAGQTQAPAASQQASSQPGQAAQTPMPGSPSSSAKNGGAAVAGGPTQNQETPEGPLELETAAQADSRAAESDQDATAAARRFAEDPWFAKLPPALRSAMQSKVRRDPPRGYEELLRRYFEE